MLKGKYGVPRTYKSGMYNITLWDFSDGYQEQKRREESLLPDHDLSYLLCFDDMKVKQRCIKKENWLMDIFQDWSGDLFIYIKGARYKQTENGFIRIPKDRASYR